MSPKSFVSSIIESEVATDGKKNHNFRNGKMWKQVYPWNDDSNAVLLFLYRSLIQRKLIWWSGVAWGPHLFFAIWIISCLLVIYWKVYLSPNDLSYHLYHTLSFRMCQGCFWALVFVWLVCLFLPEPTPPLLITIGLVYRRVIPSSMVFFKSLLKKRPLLGFQMEMRWSYRSVCGELIFLWDWVFSIHKYISLIKSSS